MYELQNLIDNLEKLKRELNTLIVKKDFNLQDPEVIKASQYLDKKLVEYSKMIKNKEL